MLAGIQEQSEDRIVLVEQGEDRRVLVEQGTQTSQKAFAATVG
jgi:hypothetical protein